MHTNFCQFGLEFVAFGIFVLTAVYNMSRASSSKRAKWFVSTGLYQTARKGRNTSE